MNVLQSIKSAINWAADDYRSYPLRFCIEITAWIISISCAITMAFTVPVPPLVFIYPAWITACMLYCWAAWSRGSIGMFANFAILSCIDVIGLIRILM